MSLSNRQTIASTLRTPAVPRSFQHTPAAGRPADPLSQFVFTANASTDTLTTASHDLGVGERIQVVNTGGALPGGLSAATDLYVIASGLTANDFKVSLSDGGAAIDVTGAGSGTNKWSRKLNAAEQAEFDVYYNFATNGQGPLPDPAFLPRVITLMDRFSAYHQSSAHLVWWHDNQNSREAQYVLRKADLVAASDDTVPVSADPSGGGSGGPTSPVSRYAL